MFASQQPETLSFQYIFRQLADFEKSIEKKYGYDKSILSAEINGEIRLLIQRVADQKGNEAASYLEKIVENITAKYKPDAVVEKNNSLINNINQEAEKFKPYFNADIYGELLPYMQLAHVYEQNGQPADHALRLAVLFGNVTDALKYLYTYFKHHLKCAPTIHDACLFALPHVNNCTFPAWQGFARKYMKEETFRKMLGQACEIEAAKNADLDVQKLKSKQLINERIEKKKKLQNKQTRWDTLRRNQKLRDKNLEEYNKLSSELSVEKIKLANLYAAVPIADNQIDLFILRCIQHKFIQESSAAYQYMLKMGLSRQDYDKFLKLDRSNAGATIPDVNIDGKAIFYPGYYLRKLQVQNDLDAAIGASLGKSTHCCQSLSGEAGEPCTIHGLTSPHGGFYVLFKGDINDPQISDKIIGQCWVWRSRSNALVFDSIEVCDRSQVHQACVIEFYRKLGLILCLDGYTHKVNCGNQSGISSQMSKIDDGLSESSIDYDNYCDSERQKCIYDVSRPYLFFADVNEATENVKNLIDEVMWKGQPFTSSPRFCQMQNWISVSQYLEHDGSYVDIHRYLHFSKHTSRFKLRIPDLTAFTSKMEFFVKKEYVYATDSEKIWQWIQDGEFYIDTTNIDGNTLLMVAIQSRDKVLVEKLLNHGANFNVRNRIGLMTLHYAAEHSPEIFDLLLMRQPALCKDNILQLKGIYGSTVLHCASKHFESLRRIIELFPPTERLDLVSLKDTSGNSFLLYVAKFSKHILKDVLELIPEGDRLSAISSRVSSCGFSILSHLEDYKNDSKLFQYLFMIIMQGEPDLVIKELSFQVDEAYHPVICTLDPEYLKIVLEKFDPNKLLDLTHMPGEFILNVARDFENFKLLLQQLDLTIVHNKEYALDDSAFKVASQESVEKLIALLAYIPENERLDKVLKAYQALYDSRQNAWNTILWKAALCLYLKEYKQTRVLNANPYSGWQFGYTKDCKLQAVDDITHLLMGKPVAQIDDVLPILRDGELGTTIRHFLKLNKPEGIETVSELIEFLKEEQVKFGPRFKR